MLNRLSWQVVGALVALLLMGVAHAAQETRMGPVTLRGYGTVSLRQSVTENTSFSEFTTENAAAARRLGSKFLEDYTHWGVMKAADGFPATALRLADVGWWVLGVKEKQFSVLFARSPEGLRALCAQYGAAGWQAVPTRAYPRWLDCFDNAGFGFGFLGAGIVPKLENDLQDMADGRYSVNMEWGVDATRQIAPGLFDTSTMDWYKATAAKYDVPYRMKYELHPEAPPWLFNRVPLPYVQPEATRLNEVDLYHYRNKSAGQFTYEPVPATEPYTLDGARRIAGLLARDDNFMAMQGAGEIVGASILLLGDVAGMPETKVAWHRYLQEVCGLSLAQVGTRYRGNPRAYTSWNDVAVPLMRDFVGDTAVDLDGVWQGRSDPGKQGKAAQWFQAGDSGTWQAMDAHDPLLLAIDRTKNDLWLRRIFSTTSAQTTKLTHLHLAMPVNGPREPFEVYLNGHLLKDLTDRHPVYPDYDNCYAVDGQLQVGENTLVINTHGSPLFGYTLLTDAGRWVYPSHEAPKNRRWVDALEFDAWRRVGALEKRLAAIRADGFDRPIQIMAPHRIMDKVLPLCVRYGAYPHDTGGAAGSWSPFDDRHATVYGVPFSAEPGGAAASVEDIRKFCTLYLLYSCDAVELIGHSGQYLWNPDIRHWMEENRPLTACIGQLDMPTPSVAVLRSSLNARLQQHGLWSWDVGRGELQGVGRTYEYVDLDAFRTGVADRFPVIIDAATEVLSDADVARIRAYVERGGTFIALHLTGQHSDEMADAWPITKLTGLKPSVPDALSQDIAFTPEETLFPSLQGKTLRGWGVALDWRNNDMSGQPLALQNADDRTKSLKVIATWQGRSAAQGNIAVAERAVGKGRVIVLGSTFWRNAKDENSTYQSNGQFSTWLDEMLTALNISRRSWVTGTADGKTLRGIWAERWQSKNGLYDLYLVSRVGSKPDEPEVTVDVSFLRDQPDAPVWEISAKDAPAVAHTVTGGKLIIPGVRLLPWQSHVYAVPRGDLQDAARSWFAIQQRYWPQLSPVAKALLPAPLATPADILPLFDDWRIGVGATMPDSWRHGDPTVTGQWSKVKMGTFLALGLPEDAHAYFFKQVTLPAGWRGQHLSLALDCVWSWGIIPVGRMWVNGQLIDLDGKGQGRLSRAYRADIINPDNGVLDIALEIDASGTKAPRARPSGVTGAFYLQAEPLPQAIQALPGPYQAVTDMQAATSVNPGDIISCVYLQTEFTVPAAWHGHIFMASNAPLGMFTLNNRFLFLPETMRRLDITRLLDPNGKNVLKWYPAQTLPVYGRPGKITAPKMELQLMP